MYAIRSYYEVGELLDRAELRAGDREQGFDVGFLGRLDLFGGDVHD